MINNRDFLIDLFINTNNGNRIKKIGYYEENEIIAEIVKGPAYTDFTPRTIKGIKKDTIIGVLDDLAMEIRDYFENVSCKNQKEFDDWHNKTCRLFLKGFKDKSGREIHYGKAQKIINMSFKYIYCYMKNVDQEKFCFCHMPIDSYILEWFCDAVLEQETDRVSKTHIMNTSWSNLECGDEKTEYSYLWMQKKIREYLVGENSLYVDEGGKKLTPFLAEFYIWPEQKIKKLCKDLKQECQYSAYYCDPRIRSELERLFIVLGEKLK
jgi:hypothetical protein